MDTPRWQQLLSHPERVDSDGVDIAVLADAGDVAYREALSKWNKIRERDDRDAHAGIAYILAEAFDDRRALEGIADAWPEVFPEELAWRVAIATPSQSMREVFGAKVLTQLREALDSEGPLPKDAARAARALYPDDRGSVYLRLRRELIQREPDSEQAERVTDDLLIAAAAATPDRPEIRRTVLAYWGEEPPLDEVPTAEPLPGNAPASWDATCHLIARSQQTAFADHVIGIATREQDSWNGPGNDADMLVQALGKSIGGTADAKLLEIAKAGVPISGRAVRALANRRRRITGAPPEMLDRTNALIRGMRDHGVLKSEPGPRTRVALAKARRADEDSQLAAVAIVEALGKSTGEEVALEWSTFLTWLAGRELPGPIPVPTVPQQKQNRGGFGKLFGKR